MNKKVYLSFIILVALVSILGIFAVNGISSDFDGLFSMNVPVGQKYHEVAYCLPNGGLGCALEYWEENAGCEINGNEFVVYYYNGSDTLDNTLNSLTSSYLYQYKSSEGDLMILQNQIEDMRNLPLYLVGKASGDGNQVVFVGGYHLDDLKKYANSIEFY